MSPGPVVEASPEVQTEQEVPFVDDATQKKKPQPQVPFTISHSFPFSLVLIPNTRFHSFLLLTFGVSFPSMLSG